MVEAMAPAISLGLGRGSRRASATSGAWAVNRVASALVPLALLPLLRSEGAMAMFGVVAAAMLGIFVLLLTLAPRGRAGQPVD